MGQDHRTCPGKESINFLTSSAVAGSNDVIGKLISGGGI